MPADYLHNHKEFESLLDILADEMKIEAGLVEKDYWIMHTLYGLQQLGLDFELKGGTSLSKGYKIISRFSEDIDIYIHPPKELDVNENPNNTKPKAVAGRKTFYYWLAEKIAINGIVAVERDPEFDNVDTYLSGGIRLKYNNKRDPVEGLKDGILLEAGFDTVTPNRAITISSWAYDLGSKKIDVIDNRAIDVRCYHPAYTFVEKLQTITTKFRKELEGGQGKPKNFMRQYYDVYSLLGNEDVLNFLGTAEYETHKLKRFSKKDREVPIRQNEAFLLTDVDLRADFQKRYTSTKALYYNGQPEFEALMKRIGEHLEKL